MILVHLRTRKKFYIDNPKDFSTNFGIIKKEDLEKATPGSIVRSHLGEEFVVFEDSLSDILDIVKRAPQITHPKDFGLLVSLTGLSPGWKVVEGGTGSGVLTCFLANIVKPDGKVYSYEKRKEFLHIAHKNISKLGLTQYVVLKNKDIRNGIDEKSVDLIVLDIPDPWNATDHAWHSLKPGGFLAIYLPNVTSILKTLNNIKGFYLEGIYECFVRRWIYREEVLRPESTQLVHTEFLILLRKMMR